jgi:hypothetical protein
MNAEQAGKYCYLAIIQYLNDIHDASYPQPPEVTGGETYKYFKRVIEKINSGELDT